MKNLTVPLYLLAVLSCLISFSESVAQGKNQLLYEETFKLYLELESDSQRNRKKAEDFDLVGRNLYRIYSKNPEWKKAQLCLLAASRVYEKKYFRFNSTEDAETALRYSREFVERYPESNHVDNSLLREAKILKVLGKKEEAEAVYRKIIKEMPESGGRRTAEEKLAELYGKTPVTEKPKPPNRSLSDGVPKRMSAVIFSIKDSVRKKTAAKKSESVKRRIPEGYATVKKIRHWSTDQDDWTRVVIELDKEVDYSENLLNPDSKLNTPPRLYVDLEKTVIDDSVIIEPVTKGLLEKITYGENRPGVSRIVLYIKSFDDHNVFTLPKSDQNSSYRIVMDIEGAGADPEEIFAEGAPSYTGRPNTTNTGTSTIESEIPEPGKKTSFSESLGLTNVETVVIDPGHGGHDPGAVGPSGLKEKDVVLRIARRLKEKLLTEGGKFGIRKVHLTRSDDRYVALEDRTAIAKKKGADIFISIHSNAARSSKAHGIETYILGFTEDERSLQLAARENAMTTRRVRDKENIVRKILAKSGKEDSDKLAKHVHDSMIRSVSSKYSHIKDRNVKPAPFLVLLGTKHFPSLLVETAFITNTREEKRLQSAAYIEKIVDGITEGIKEYSMRQRTRPS